MAGYADFFSTKLCSNYYLPFPVSKDNFLNLFTRNFTGEELFKEYQSNPRKFIVKELHVEVLETIK
jgi:hypothetical protein